MISKADAAERIRNPMAKHECVCFALLPLWFHFKKKTNPNPERERERDAQRIQS